MTLNDPFLNDDLPSAPEKLPAPLNGKRASIGETGQEIEPNNLDHLCKSCLEKNEHILALGIVDLSTGILLGVHHLVPHFTTYLDVAAATVVQWFKGREVAQIESSISQHYEKKITDSIEEIFLSTPRIFLYMKVVPTHDAALVQVLKRTGNQAQGWISLRNAVPEIQTALDSLPH